MRSPVGLADFVRATGALGADERAAGRIAALLGYELEAEAREPQADAARDNPAPQPEPAGSGAEAAPSSAALALIEEPAVFEPAGDEGGASPEEPTWWKTTTPFPEEAPGQSWAIAPLDPLFPRGRQRDIVRRMIETRAAGHRIDGGALARLLAERRPYRTLPRQSVLVVAGRIAAIVDDTARMRAFDADIGALARDLRALAGRAAVIVKRTTAGRAATARAAGAASLTAGARAVVLVSDFFGAGGERLGDGAADWAPVVRTAAADGARVVALVPAGSGPRALGDLPAAIVEWSRRARAADVRRRRMRTPPPPAPGAALRLATLLSPAVRIEPALLRAMRLRQGRGAGPEAEATLRASQLVDVSNALGFTLRKDVRTRLMARLARRPADLAAAFDVIQSVHTGGPPALATEEHLTRLALERKPGWQDQSASALRSITRGMTRERSGLARWLEQAVARLPTESLGTQAAAEAVTRASAVLNRPITAGGATATAATGATAFLRQAPWEERTTVSLTVVDPEAAALDFDELMSLSRPAREMIERRLYLSPGSLSALKADQQSSPILKRQVKRQRGPSVSLVSIRQDAPLSVQKALQRLAGEMPMQITSGPPRDDSESGRWWSEYADIVIADAREGPESVAELLRQITPDSGVLLCIVQDEGIPIRHTAAFVEMIPHTDEETTTNILRSILAFVGHKRRMRMRAVESTDGRSGARVEIPRWALPRLRAGDQPSATARASDGPPRETVIEGPRGAWSLGYDGHTVGQVRPLPDLWLARLHRAACSVTQDGQQTARPACILPGGLIATHYGGLRSRGEVLEAGVVVRVAFGGEHDLRTHVVAARGGIALIDFPEPGQAYRALTPEDDPPDTGAALTMAFPGPAGLPRFIWGQVRRQTDGQLELTLESSVDDALLAATLPGAPVLIEGRYAAQVSNQLQQGGGRWRTRLIPVRASMFTLEDRTSRSEPSHATGSGDAHDIFISFTFANAQASLARWIESSLIPALEEELSLVGESPSIFIESRDGDPGDEWPDALRSAILRSKVLVPLMTPQYFRSEWHARAWALFERREQLRGGPLIFPALLGRPEALPKYVKERQWLDLQDMVLRRSRKPSVSTRQRLRALAETITKALDSTHAVEASPHEWDDVEERAQELLRQASSRDEPPPFSPAVA